MSASTHLQERIMNPQHHPATEHVLHPLTGEAPALDEQAAQNSPDSAVQPPVEEPAEAAPLQNSGGSYTTAPAATSGSPLLWGLGAAGLIGTAAVLAKSGSDKNPTANHPPPTATPRLPRPFPRRRPPPNPSSPCTPLPQTTSSTLPNPDKPPSASAAKCTMPKTATPLPCTSAKHTTTPP
uniref:Uncharacterized protein n=1 Tax=Conchiformibius kuhniae TaxID=211502 RepID=A0A8T9MUA1_9NEIS|nr:hypothetical protein LVJ77_08920 [Conchiformibius kuhniae]